MIKEYIDFLETKKTRIEKSGFEPKKMSPKLKDFQSWIVSRACQFGRMGIFAECGLGKTIMGGEWATQVSRQTSRPVIWLSPLGVTAQTIDELTEKFGYDAGRHGHGDFQIQITNYENLDHIDFSQFGGVVLDESSILKNYDGKTKQKLIDLTASMEYKLPMTATPSPNDPMELGNHAEFLGVMGRNEMLSMFFVHDGGETAKWRLKKHGVMKFYEWVATWAVMLSKPSDIGFSDDGYGLPGLNMNEFVIETEKRDNGMLFNIASVSATDINQEIRMTIIPRIEAAAELVNNNDEQWVVWVKSNEEGPHACKIIPDAVEVKGSDSVEYKESKLLGFAKNEFRVLVTKTKIAQYGLNYQNCHNSVFAAVDFGFEGLYQAIRRFYRFGQKEIVNIYIITTDSMTNVIESLREKEKKHHQNQIMMAKAISKFANKKEDKKKMSEKSKPKFYETENGKIFLGDCVQLGQDMEDQSVHFSIFSPPFAELYTYSDKTEDMGNSKDYKEFLYAFGYLVKNLARVMVPGRNVAVHCMDLPIQKGKEGFIGLRDFSGLILEAFQNEGFIYHSRVTIWKNPVIEMQRTKALGLLHKQVKKDSVMSRVGIPDYLMVFRAPGDNPIPIRCPIDVDTWQKFASPVWMDIDYSKTLNFREGRHENDEKHICPLQLDTIERAITLWSNPGETVYSPFGGVGSELYQAIAMRRKAIGHELKESYFELACKNIDLAESIASQGELFVS